MLQLYKFWSSVASSVYRYKFGPGITDPVSERAADNSEYFGLFSYIKNTFELVPGWGRPGSGNSRIRPTFGTVLEHRLTIIKTFKIFITTRLKVLYNWCTRVQKQTAPPPGGSSFALSRNILKITVDYYSCRRLNFVACARPIDLLLQSCWSSGKHCVYTHYRSRYLLNLRL